MVNNIVTEVECFYNNCGGVSLVKVLDAKSDRAKYNVHYSLERVPGWYRCRVHSYKEYSDAIKRFNRYRGTLMATQKLRDHGK